jgi:galactokinase
VNTDQLIAEYSRHFGTAPRFVARAPGRVNLIGEHTDYNDGFVFPMAIQRAVTLVGTPRTDGIVRVHSVNFAQTAEFSLTGIAKGDPDWLNYIKGVARVMLDHGHALTGFDAVAFGDVPLGSGLSSSAAVEMATVQAFLASDTLGNGAPRLKGIDGVAAAKIGQRCENTFIGVNSGIMDQFISALGKAGYALKIDCKDYSYTLVPMPQGATVLVVDTTAPRTLAGSAYNQRRADCEAGAMMLGVDSLRGVSMAQFKQRQRDLPTQIMHRVAHVVLENQRVHDAEAAMKRGDLEELGLLMYHSHESLRDLYEVSSKELDTVVELAREAGEGVHGARMTGAGFGGCAIVLVDDAHVARVKALIEDQYPKRTGRGCHVYASIAADGAGWRAL